MKKIKKKEEGKSEKKKFPKIHVLDVVIILLVIAVLAGVYFRYNVFDSIGNLQSQSEVQITFSIKNIKDSSKHYVEIGDNVYFKSDGKEFGTIMESTENSDVALIVTPAWENFIADEGKDMGKYISVNYPQGTRVDAEGKIKCSGVITADGTFLLGGSRYISAGQTETICTERATFEITVLSIEKIDA